MTEPRERPRVRPGIPAQRSPGDHPMRPDLPTARHAAAARSGTARHRAASASGTGPTYGAWRHRAAALLVDLLLQVPFLVVLVVGLVVAFDGGGLTRIERASSGPWNDGLEVQVHQMTTHTWVGLTITFSAAVALLVFAFWNHVVRQGRHGASLGKSSMNLVVVFETSGRPIGALLTWVRAWAHAIDLVLVGAGFLWPLWDTKRQTFADMVMRTTVLRFPSGPVRPAAPLARPVTPRYDW